MGRHDAGMSRHAAVLQLVAEQLRELELLRNPDALEQCSSAIESVAAALICADKSFAQAVR